MHDSSLEKNSGELLVRRVMRYSARHAWNKEGKRETKRKGGNEVEKRGVYSFSACGPSLECRYGLRAGTITEPTNAGESHANAHVAGPCVWRNPWIGKYLESAEKYLAYVCTYM